MQLAAALLWNTIGYACSSGVERRSTQVVNWSMRAADGVFSKSGIMGVSVGPVLMPFTQLRSDA